MKSSPRLVAARASLAFFVVVSATCIVALLTRKQGPRGQGVKGPSAAEQNDAAPAPSSLGALLGDASAPARVGMIHGDARHTHRAIAVGPRAAKELWKTKLGGAVQAQVIPSPDEKMLYADSLDGKLHALETSTGKEVWAFDFGNRAYCTPVVDENGTIYAGSDDKKLFAIGPDGKKKWVLETDGEIDTGIARAPDGTMAVVSGRDLLRVRKSGEIVWRFSVKSKIFTSPAIAEDGLTVFGAQDHRAYGIDARGKKVFAVDLGADVDGSPAIGDGGEIYVGTDNGEVVRLDAQGSVVWSTPVGGFVRGVLSVARNGDILAGVYGPAPRQVRIAPDGRIRGSFPIQGTGAKEHGIHGGALEDAAGTLYFGAQDDKLYAVSASGELLFGVTAQADVDAPATVLSDGTLVFAVDDGTVYHLGP